MAEKTEEPTQKKLQDAREEGQVVKSELIIKGAQLMTITLWLWMQGPKLVIALQDTFGRTIDYVLLPLNQALWRVLTQCIEVLLHFVGSLITVVFFTTVLSGVLQTGFLFALKKLIPKMDALNPINNIKNIFSVKKIYGLFRTLLMICLLALVFFHIFRTYSRSFLYLPACGVDCALPLIGRLAAWLFVCLIAFYIVFAGIDYFFERYQLRKQLRMSKHDVRQEYKDIESNPEMKGRIRGLHNEMQQEDTASRVQQSNAVVRNPTHLAVCLYYEPEETPLPMVIEKGAGLMAEKIIQLAERFKIPILENVPLARRLMADTKIGDYIPEALFEPVAEVLRIAMLEREETLEAEVEDIEEVDSADETLPEKEEDIQASEDHPHIDADAQSTDSKEKESGANADHKGSAPDDLAKYRHFSDRV